MSSTASCKEFISSTQTSLVNATTWSSRKAATFPKRSRTISNPLVRILSSWLTWDPVSVFWPFALQRSLKEYLEQRKWLLGNKRIGCLGHVHTYIFSCENGDFSVRFRLPSTLKRLFSVFESLRFHRKRRLSKTGLKVETFENAALSCGEAKTETFENGVDLKTYTCGRVL